MKLKLSTNDIVTLVGLGVAAVLIVWAVRGWAGSSWTKDLENESVAAKARAREFVEAVRDGRHEDAWKLTDEVYRGAIDLERFREGIKANRYLSGAQSVAFGLYEGFGSAARVKGILTGTSGTVECIFNLSEKDSKWWITEVTLGGTPSLPRSP